MGKCRWCNRCRFGCNGAGIGIGQIGKGAVEAIARQPEAINDIRANMILTAAFVEGVALFAVIAGILAMFSVTHNILLHSKHRAEDAVLFDLKCVSITKNYKSNYIMDLLTTLIWFNHSGPCSPS